MLTAKRQLLGYDTFVAFGASEIMMPGLRSGFLETTVTSVMVQELLYPTIQSLSRV